MKYIIAALLLVSCSAWGQTSFEGKITYKVLLSDDEGNVNQLLTLHFSKPGIRIDYSNSEDAMSTKEVLIFNFDSSKLFTLRPKTKSYTEKILETKQQHHLPVAKTIAGFSTSPALFTSDQFNNDAALVFGDAVFYAADSLYYIVPEKYARISELLMVNEGRIVLGADFYPPHKNTRQWNLENTLRERDHNTIQYKVEAREVIHQPIDASLFVPPAAFTEQRSDFPFSMDSLDSVTTILIDTAVSIPARTMDMPTRKKQKPSPTKSPAHRRKGR